MIAVLGFFAAALSIAVVWPQVWLSCRHGRTLGLSPTSSWLGVALNLSWLSFGLLIGDRAQVVTNVVVGAGNTAVLAALLLSQPQLRSRQVLLRSATGAAALAAFAVGCLAAVALLGADRTAVAATLGSVIGVVGAAAVLPQPLGLLLNKAQDLSGLSPARWRLGAGSCASWAGYGVLIGQPMMSISAGFGLCCALVMCAVLQARRTTVPVGGVVEARRPVTVAARRHADVHVRAVPARMVLAAA